MGNYLLNVFHYARKIVRIIGIIATLNAVLYTHRAYLN